MIRSAPVEDVRRRVIAVYRETDWRMGVARIATPILDG
jgi:hypothetical protein